MITVKGSGNQVIMLFRGEIIAKYDRDYRHNQTHYRLEHYIGLIEKRPRSVYNAAPIKETVPTELYQFLMKLSSPMFWSASCTWFGFMRRPKYCWVICKNSPRKSWNRGPADELP